MIKLSNTAIISIISKLLILLVVAKALSLVLWWYLPDDGIEMKVKNNYQPKYQRVQLRNMIKPEVKVVEKVVEKKVETIGITNMLLKGLYGTSTKAFVIISMKATPKNTKIIGIGESFKGYKLKSIAASSAIFEKGSKDYILELDVSKRGKGSRKKSVGNITKVTDSNVATNEVQAPSNTGTGVRNDDDEIGVSRKDIAFYAKNPKQIWRDISIGEVKKRGKIIGFKVRKIKKTSKFAQLGLQMGDIIIKANNIRLQSYKDAMNIYKNINKLDTIQIVVLRRNQEVELVYDIN